MNPRAHPCLFLSLFLFFSSPDLLAGSPAMPGDDAPEVVQIEPENGSGDVDPGLDEIKITFSEPMTDGSWSVTGGGENFPDIKSIYYTKNCTVLVMKVKLKPGWSYRFGINSPSHRNFKSKKGIPVEPMLVTFKTRGKGAGKKRTGKSALPSLGKLEFSLLDANGLKVESQDYKGVPLFIAFGAAW
jgi:hypothetical protein